MVVVVSPGSLGMATPIDELLGSSDYEFYQELDSYRDLGVDWFRLQINWNEVQATSGNYWWTKIDKVVKALVEYDIKIVGLFEGKASWASSTFSDSYTKNAWANFVYTATQRYSDVIDVWEIMNEPNVQNINPYNYTDALILSYNAIKSVDQDATVISAGTAAVPFSSGSFWGAAEYLQIMYQQGAKEYMDAVGFHPYTWPLQPTNPASYNGWQIMESDLRSIMTSYGDANKQIWMTELGAPTQGSGSAMTQAEQAQMIEEAYYLSQEYSWAGPILYYSYQDRGGSASDTENWFGLVDPYGNPKQAYYTFQHLASLNDSGEAKVYTFDSLSDLYISDFSSGDVLDFSGLDGNTDASGTQTFDFIGSNWLTAAGQVAVFVNTAAQLTYVQGYTRHGKAESISRSRLQVSITSPPATSSSPKKAPVAGETGMPLSTRSPTRVQGSAKY